MRKENEELRTILGAFRTGCKDHACDAARLLFDLDEHYESIAKTLSHLSLGELRREDVPTLAEATTPLPEALANLGSPLTSFSNGVRNTRHYRSTSHLAILDPDSNSCGISVEQLGPWTTVTADEKLIKHLLHLYFTWTHPFFALFSEELFWHGFDSTRLKYCSPILVNAVLALACNFSDRPEGLSNPCYPESAGTQFFAEAERLVADNGQSCLTTIQAFGVMSIREAMNGHYSSAWGYVARMMAMLDELGLHIPCNGLTNAEAEARKITFWGCYVLGNAWAICDGHRSALPPDDIWIERSVSREATFESRIWKPYSDENAPEKWSQFEQPGSTYSLLLQSILLSEIVNDTVRTFSHPVDGFSSRKQQLQQLRDRFQEWLQALPENLRVRHNAPSLPHVLTLQQVYQIECEVSRLLTILAASTIITASVTSSVPS